MATSGAAVHEIRSTHQTDLNEVFWHNKCRVVGEPLFTPNTKEKNGIIISTS